MDLGIDSELRKVLMTEFGFATVDGGFRKGEAYLADLADNLKAIIGRHPNVLPHPNDECVRQMIRFKNRVTDNRAIAKKLLEAMCLHRQAKLDSNTPEWWEAALGSF